MYTACIFDLDGTLLDTIQDITDAMNAVLSRYHLVNYRAEDVRRMVGNGVRPLIGAATAKETDPTLLDRVLDKHTELYTRGCMKKTRPYPGVAELLKILQDRGVKLMVLSNKGEENTARLIAHYFPEIHFLRVYGARTDRPLKPDPAAVKELVGEFSLDLGKTLFIGDSDVDILTAQNAGIRSAGVSWGYRSREVLESAGAAFIADHAEELRRFILGG